MNTITSILVTALVAISGLALGVALSIADEELPFSLHAEGAQIYECKLNTDGTPTWHFREPIAALLQNGKTIGHHSAGPRWDLSDGSSVTAKVIDREPGMRSNDIPHLRLRVTNRTGSGQLDKVVTIARVNTRGGVAEEACADIGGFLSVPYAADYVFSTSKYNH